MTPSIRSALAVVLVLALAIWQLTEYWTTGQRGHHLAGLLLAAAALALAITRKAPTPTRGGDRDR